MRLSLDTTSPAYIQLRARPLRQMVLVPEIPNLDWRTVFAGALSSQVRVWGGQANLPLPLRADVLESELFWSLVQLWDPDWWGIYAGSNGELEELAPEIYATWRSELDELLQRQQEQSVRQELSERAHAETLNVDDDLPSDLHELLVARGATLHHEGKMILRAPFTGTGSPPYPSVDVLRLKALPDEVHELAVEGDETERLLIAAEFGILSPDLRRELEDAGVRRTPARPATRIELLGWLYGAGTAGAPSAPTPFALSEPALGWYRSTPLTADTMYLVAGEDAWDFTLAYALRRANALAWWVPESAFTSALERESAHRTIAAVADRFGGPVLATSATDEAATAALVAALSPHVNAQTSLSEVAWQSAIPPRANRLLVRNRIELSEPHHLDGGRTHLLRTPIPAFPEAEVDAVRWMTDILVNEWAAMKHPNLGEQLVGPLDSSSARTSAEGVAYACPNWALSLGLGLEQQTVRPHLAPLPLFDQLRTVATAAGWQCELSQKGQFTIAVADLFGGFDQLAEALRDSDIQDLFMGYLDGTAQAQGLRLGDRRRYLTLDDIRGVVSGRPAEDVLSELEARSVLARGVILKCPRCRYTAWYRPRDTDPTFSCARCSAESHPDSDAWLQQAELRGTTGSTRWSSNSCGTPET